MGTDQTEQNEAVVRAFMAAMEQKDYDTALAFVTPDCDYVNMPMGGVTGPEGIRSVLEPFFGGVLENEFVLRNVLAQGDVVVVERLDRHRLPNGWAELPVTGVLELEGGLIKAWREYFDLETIMKGMTANA